MTKYGILILLMALPSCTVAKKPMPMTYRDSAIIYDILKIKK